MTAAQKDIPIEQGSTFDKTYTYYDASENPVNLTGYTADMIARENIESCNIIFHLTTENGGIILGGIAGTIRLKMSATTTAAINADGGVFTLKIISSGGIVTRLWQANILMDKEVPDARNC